MAVRRTLQNSPFGLPQTRNVATVSAGGPGQRCNNWDHSIIGQNRLYQLGNNCSEFTGLPTALGWIRPSSVDVTSGQRRLPTELILTEIRSLSGFCANVIRLERRDR